MVNEEYFEAARKNEGVFRAVLRDIKNNRGKRPGGIYVPSNLDTESDIETIFEKYSKGKRYGIFTIADFAILEDRAVLSFRDVAALSGGGATLEYKIGKNNSVEFDKNVGIWMS